MAGINACLSQIRDVSLQYRCLVDKLSPLSHDELKAASSAAEEERKGLKDSFITKKQAARRLIASLKEQGMDIHALMKEQELLELMNAYREVDAMLKALEPWHSLAMVKEPGHSLDGATAGASKSGKDGTTRPLTTRWQPCALPAGSERAFWIDRRKGMPYSMKTSHPTPWAPCVRRTSALCSSLAEFDAAFRTFCPCCCRDHSQKIYASTFDEGMVVAAVAVELVTFWLLPSFGRIFSSESFCLKGMMPLLRLERVTRDADGIVTLSYSVRRCSSLGYGESRCDGYSHHISQQGSLRDLIVGLPRAGLRGVRWVEDGFEVARNALLT